MQEVGARCVDGGEIRGCAAFRKDTFKPFFQTFKCYGGISFKTRLTIKIKTPKACKSSLGDTWECILKRHSDQ